MLPNNVVNVFCRVSVRTNVPEMKVTPSTIASAVSASLSLWASRPLRVTFRIGQPPSVRIRSRTESAVGWSSSPTTVPSARKMTRSA